MPTLILNTNHKEVSSEKEVLLHSCFREILSEELNKSESFVLSVLNFGKSMQFGGATEKSAYVEVKNVGEIPKDKTSVITGRICLILEDKLGLKSEYCYVDFQESARHLWGWAGKTFAD